MFAYTLSGQINKSSTPFTEQQKIDYLIKCVEDLKNAKFDRNGTLHEAQAAGAHLKMKREKAGNAIKTVDDFIYKVASKSSTTGYDYKIIYDSGVEMSAKDFYLKCLKDLELKTSVDY
jgi:hypothetical protein